MSKVIDAVAMLRRMRVGQGSLSAREIAWWTHIPTPTVYRILRKAEKMGFLVKESDTYKNTVVHSWFVTEQGQDYLVALWRTWL